MKDERYGRSANGERFLRLEAPREARVLDHVITGPRAWTRATLRPEEWLLRLSAAAVAEILEVVAQLREAPLPVLEVAPGPRGLAACRAVMAAVRQQVAAGPGLVLVEGLPVEQLSSEEASAVFWLLGRLLSRPVATKWDGTLLYHVTDTGRRFGYGVRGSATNVELSFHTDNAFGVALPDAVGLFCIQPALEGGVSRCCSLYTVHNELLRHQPELLRRLYQPCYYDRQAEHAPEEPKLLQAPVFHWDGERLSARLTPNLIRRGYEMAGEPMGEELAAALAGLEGVLAREELRIELTLRRGHIQYLNNHWCGHFRSAFRDGEDPALKRHLLRVWYRDWGGPGYDGEA